MPSQRRPEMSGNIMIVGVGGQGTLLASKLLGKLFLEKGLDVKVSEVHGMSQRGGSVVTYVRYGEKVFSPVIDKGQADIIISFEILEAARYVEYLKKGGLLITNTQQINPMPVITGAASYPENLEEKLSKLNIELECFDALSLAKKAGSTKAVNLALLGKLSKHFDFTEEQWLNAIETSVPEKFLALNKKAFLLGRDSQ
jgi:indolepyruvate ferredoxin oxidoreductase beta subunit